MSLFRHWYGFCADCALIFHAWTHRGAVRAMERHVRAAHND